MARSHTKDKTKMRVLATALLRQLYFTVLPNLYFLTKLCLNSCCLSLGAGVYLILLVRGNYARLHMHALVVSAMKIQNFSYLKKH